MTRPTGTQKRKRTEPSPPTPTEPSPKRPRTHRDLKHFNVATLRTLQNANNNKELLDDCLGYLQELVEKNWDLAYIRIRLDVKPEFRFLDRKKITDELISRGFTCKHYRNDDYVCITNTWTDKESQAHRGQKYRFVNFVSKDSDHTDHEDAEPADSDNE